MEARKLDWCQKFQIFHQPEGGRFYRFDREGKDIPDDDVISAHPVGDIFTVVSVPATTEVLPISDRLHSLRDLSPRSGGFR